MNCQVLRLIVNKQYQNLMLKKKNSDVEQVMAAAQNSYLVDENNTTKAPELVHEFIYI